VGRTERPERYFHGQVDSQNAASRCVAAAAFARARYRLALKIVVRMQHTFRTFIEKA
jgi:hypothetical protein